MTGENGEWHPPRRLKVFAFDPTTAKAYANRTIRHVTISLPWEMDPDIGLGPTGEYLEVIDYDPASQSFYRPIQLDDARILSNGGLDPSEENPQFHQQMVYAVAMNTIATFEEALGRQILWAADEYQTETGEWVSNYVQRLRIYPHALREANAYYSPQRKALLFGYFEAHERSETVVPGTTVFTCLSHDIIVHETTHALLDGMHPHFAEASHPDMRALHEAFADIVAIFQLFSFPEVLVDQIARTRGDLESQSMLAQLAQEFGMAMGRSAALRDALGEVDRETGEWRMKSPDRTLINRVMAPHARGSILVAAVFRTFVNVYKDKTEDLFRIASGGTGILPEGSIDPDLAQRLAREAAIIARRTLRICIRGLDYVPPVAVSFGDYLRAIITADHDLFPEDADGYRTAILEAFSAWGIVPEGMPVVTGTTLLWPTLSQTLSDLKATQARSGRDVSIEAVRGGLGGIIKTPREEFADLQERMRRSQSARSVRGVRSANRQEQRLNSFFAKVEDDHTKLIEAKDQEIGNIDAMRQQAPVGEKPRKLKRIGESENTSDFRMALGQAPTRQAEFVLRDYYARLIWMLAADRLTPELAHTLGIAIDFKRKRHTVRRSQITGKPSLHVLPVRRALRVGKRHELQDEFVIELVQTRYGLFDPAAQKEADADPDFSAAKGYDFKYRAGCTLLVDADSFNIRRLIRTPYVVDDDRGLNRLRAFLGDARQGIRNAFNDGDPGNPETAFADLHRNPYRAEEDW